MVHVNKKEELSIAEQPTFAFAFAFKGAERRPISSFDTHTLKLELVLVEDATRKKGFFFFFGVSTFYDLSQL